ncbi:MAG: hypothetical protein JSW11_00790 [Candidatus Heimdallarchaeota archaeon]|nr:MAG: hypothetical protein JSW11_00790 [Candidatus Heimdallarchaeota archaeon]
MHNKNCNCCTDRRPGHFYRNRSYRYNHLTGKAREWAIKNSFPLSERTVPVKGGKKFGGPDWIKNKCGDGRMGFQTRNSNANEVRIEIGLDGQFKKVHRSIIKPKSARAATGRRPRRVDGSKFCLVSKSQIAESKFTKQAQVARKKLLRMKNKSRQTLSRKERIGRENTIDTLRLISIY